MTPRVIITGLGDVYAACTDCKWQIRSSHPVIATRAAARHTCTPNNPHPPGAEMTDNTPDTLTDEEIRAARRWASAYLAHALDSDRDSAHIYRVAAAARIVLDRTEDPTPEIVRKAANILRSARPTDDDADDEEYFLALASALYDAGHLVADEERRGHQTHVHWAHPATSPGDAKPGDAWIVSHPYVKDPEGKSLVGVAVKSKSTDEEELSWTAQWPTEGSADYYSTDDLNFHSQIYPRTDER